MASFFLIPMITIRKSETADTRTCDFANVSKKTLLASSLTHIGDVVKAMSFFISKLVEAAGQHDYDKLTDIDWFHQDFVTGFKQTGWWDNHRKIHRHHLAQADGVPKDVNLLDVLEYISDCVMAGMARSGSVHEVQIAPELLDQAFKNTVALLLSQVALEAEKPDYVVENVSPAFAAWFERLKQDADTYTRSEALKRAGEPCHIYQSDALGDPLWVVALLDDFWMDAFHTREEAEEFVCAMGWPLESTNCQPL